MKVWIVLEQEPGNDDFPSVVAGVYSTKKAATEAIKEFTTRAAETYPQKRIGEHLDLWFELDGLHGHEVQG